MDRAWTLVSRSDEVPGAKDECEPSGEARLLRPERRQHVFEDSCLDLQLPPEHRARLVWAFVEKADTRELTARVRARTGRPGAPAIEPRLLLALWLYATLDGVGSARELARLCEEHLAYRWLCGRVGVNHHTLSDFRGAAGSFLDGLLSAMIAALIHAGVVSAETIVQDGTKVRAGAGAASFRSRPTLEALRAEAAAHVERVKREASDAALGARRRAARERAARERLERIEAALAAMPEAEAIKRNPGAKPGVARVSTTDAQARRMKMGDGGTRPAYNVQMALDARSRAIIGVMVSAAGSDHGLGQPMRRHVEARTGVAVREHITDGGYINKEQIEEEEGAGVAVIQPLPKARDGTPCLAHPDDGPGVAAWRARMQTPEAQEKLAQRAGIAETPHAELKTYRALDRLLVRGVERATAVALLGAVAYNLLHFATHLLAVPTG